MSHGLDRAAPGLCVKHASPFLGTSLSVRRQPGSDYSPQLRLKLKMFKGMSVRRIKDRGLSPKLGRGWKRTIPHSLPGTRGWEPGDLDSRPWVQSIPTTVKEGRPSLLPSLYSFLPTPFIPSYLFTFLPSFLPSFAVVGIEPSQGHCAHLDQPPCHSGPASSSTNGLIVSAWLLRIASAKIQCVVHAGKERKGCKLVEWLKW
jgi:hypothetical protein